MLLKLLRAKLHQATVTEANVDYVGSLTVDPDLLEAVGILPNECILVADLNNGSRHETYAIPGKRGSGVICVNGAAAHLVNVGDRVIVMCFAYLTPEEAASFRPRIALLDPNNRIVRTI